MENIFLYSDNSKCTITGKGKEITLDQAIKYHNQYGAHADKSIYQQYPKANNEPMELIDVIEELEGAE